MNCRGKLSSELKFALFLSFLRFASCNSCNIWSVVSSRIRDSRLVSVNVHLTLSNRKLFAVCSVTWQHREGAQGISRQKKTGQLFIACLLRVVSSWVSNLACGKHSIVSRKGIRVFPFL